MYKLVEWFQINYPHLRDELKNSMHNFDDKDLNPYHLESDCWSHTMMVCKISQIEEYDKVVQIAALLHDIGKPSTRKINPKNNHVQFFGHEKVSACMSVEILKQMLDENMIDRDEFVEIFLLIALHSTFHKEKNIVTLFEKFRDYKSLFIHLVELNKCDSMGRFCEDFTDYDKKESTLKSISLDMVDSKIPYYIFDFINKKNLTINDVSSLPDELFS